MLMVQLIPILIHIIKEMITIILNHTTILILMPKPNLQKQPKKPLPKLKKLLLLKQEKLLLKKLLLNLRLLNNQKNKQKNEKNK